MNGRKLGVLMVLALLVFSMPIAFAQENMQEEDTQGTMVQHGKDITEPKHIQDIRQNAFQAQEKFEIAQGEIQRNRAQVAKCLTGASAAGCSATLEQDFTNRIDYLHNTVNRIEAVMENLREKAHNIQDLNEREDALAKIQERIDTLHEFRQKIDSVEDRAQMKDLRNEFVDFYKDLKTFINEYRVSTRIGVMQNINQKLIGLNARIGHIADRLDEKGVTLGEAYPAKYENLQKAIAEAESKLELARERYQHAVDLKNSGASQEEVQAAIAEGKTYLKQVKEKVRTAKSHVGDILQAFQTRAGSQTLTEAIAETAEE